MPVALRFIRRHLCRILPFRVGCKLGDISMQLARLTLRFLDLLKNNTHEFAIGFVLSILPIFAVKVE